MESSEYPFPILVFLVALIVDFDKLDPVGLLEIGVYHPYPRLSALPLERPTGELSCLKNPGALDSQPRNFHNAPVINPELMEEPELDLDEIFQVLFERPESLEQPLDIPLKFRQADDFFKRRRRPPGPNRGESCRRPTRTR